MAKGKKTGGRQKGVRNKVTGELKDMILGALADAGGQEYLAIQAKESPAAFMTLLGKILPMQVNGGEQQPALPVKVDIQVTDATVPRGDPKA